MNRDQLSTALAVLSFILIIALATYSLITGQQ